MDQMELLKHTDKINELLARYGVKFGIYKNNVFKGSSFPLIPFRGSSGMKSFPDWKRD